MIDAPLPSTQPVRSILVRGKMTAALKQLLRDVASVAHDVAAASVRAALAALRKAWAVGILLLFVLLIWRIVVVTPPRPSPTELAVQREGDSSAEKQRRQMWQIKRFLCLEAKVCKKYNEARLECATAGNFKTCLRIKMDEDASYAEVCSGYDLGAPAVPLPPETPNAVECFLLTFGR
jgi:hypothetical protein